MLRSFVTALLIGFVCQLSGQINHYESLIIPGDTFSYLVPKSTVNNNWKYIFDKNETWEKGPTGIGYGDGDDNTVIENTISLYLTKSFNIVDKAKITSLLLDIDYDDGFVAYLNGKEIARNNVKGNPPSFNQNASFYREATMISNGLPERYELDKSMLNNGLNKLAIQVHNQSASSSDMSMIPTLSVGIKNSKYNYKPTPSWFVIPPTKVTLTKSHLPIVVVNTINGSAIPNEPKIEGEMHIIYHPDSVYNSVLLLNDKNTLHYSGNIGIEIRGSSSALLDKKQYALTTVKEDGSNNNVSLFGFPTENDWILNSMAYDSSLVRDFINYRLSERIGMYASRGKYCELILNGEYAGIYLFQEKLKVDGNRIDITKMDISDNEGEYLTGGYIIKADKIEGTDPLGWSMPNGIGWNANYVYEYPKPNNISSAQAEYIQEYFWDLADKSTNPNIINGYPSIIDIPSFVDFMLLNELASNGDAYQFSTFHHKDRNGKLKAGPIWDMNLTFGNDIFAWGYDRSLTNVWQHYDFENVGAAYWHELFVQENFNCQLAKRWQKLSAPDGPLSAKNINKLIDSAANIFGDALLREQQTWQSATNFNQEIANINVWTQSRVAWMSKSLGNITSCPEDKKYPLVISRIHYHPNGEDNYAEDDLEYLEITNASDSVIDLSGLYFGGYDIVYRFRNNAKIQANSKIHLANNTKAFNQFYGKTAFGEYSKNLSNAGTNLKLLDAFGNVIDRVPYKDSLPWPVDADGDGFCLELKDFFSDNSLAVNWTTASPTLNINKEENFNIALFPNPSDGQITIQSDRKILGIEIVDLTGKMVLSEYVNSPTASFVLNLNAGIYAVKIRSEDGLVKSKNVAIYNR